MQTYSGQSPRILLIKLSALGDVIHTLPTLEALRATYPQAWITWLVEEAAAPLLIGHPALDDVWVSRRRPWLRPRQNGLLWARAARELIRLIHRLRKSEFDLVIDIQGLLKSALWVALAAVIALFLFNSASIMWWGGFAVGPRYLLPMLPFMALPLVFVFRAWGERAWMRFLAGLLCAWSLVATWGLTLAGQSFPPDTIRNPLLEYAWPHWLAGDIARNLGMFLHLPGIASLLPLLVLMMTLFAGLSVSVRSAQVERVEKI